MNSRLKISHHAVCPPCALIARTLHLPIARRFLWTTGCEQCVLCEACFLMDSACYCYSGMAGGLVCVCVCPAPAPPGQPVASIWGHTSGIIVNLVSLLTLNSTDHLSEARPCLFRWPLEWQQRPKHSSDVAECSLLKPEWKTLRRFSRWLWKRKYNSTVFLTLWLIVLPFYS